jgi:guanylate kinase
MDALELRELVDSYRPNTETLDALASIQILGTVGPSASGKTTVMKALARINPEFQFILDETNRPPREGEQNRVDYIFRSQEEILADLKRGALVQVALGPNGHLYCTRLSSYPDGIGLMALVPAAVKEMRRLPFKSFQAAFIVPESFEHWQNWLSIQAKKGRWDNQKLKERLEEAKKSYEFALSDNQIKFVLNDSPDKAARRLMEVAGNQTPGDEELARSIAQTNYKRL